MYAENRKLYFLHIPKTAGNSLRYWLWDSFFIEDFLECYHVPDLEELTPSQLHQAWLYSGHFGGRLYEFLPSPPISLTVLREPLKRVCSEIRFLRTRSDEGGRDGSWSYPAFVDFTKSQDMPAVFKSKLYLEASANTQVRFLGGNPPNGELNPVSGRTYDRARLALEHLDAFGMVERMTESLLVFCERLGWPARTSVSRSNESPPILDNAFDESLREAEPLILETNTWDLKLYDFARPLFDERVNQLRARFGLTQPGGEDKAAEIEALKSAMLARFVDSAFPGEPVRYGRIKQSAGLFIDGWAERVYWPPINRWLRWAGPEDTNTIYLPLDRSRGRIDLRFEVFYPRDPETLSEIILRVDGCEVPMRHRIVKEGDDAYFYICEAELPQLGSPVRRWTTISMTTPSERWNARTIGDDNAPTRKWAFGNIDLL